MVGCWEDSKAHLGIGLLLNAFITCSFLSLWNARSFTISDELHRLHLQRAVCLKQSVCLCWM